MEQYFDILSRCPLFAGIRREDMAGMLSCLGGRVVAADKGSPVFLEGDPARYVGVLLSGKIQVVRDDYYGKRSVLTVVSPGGYFGEAFACAGVTQLPTDILAASDCRVLYLGSKTLLHSCDRCCSFHHQLIANLLGIVSRKNLYLNQKLSYTSRGTTKEKLLAYLSDQAKQHHSNEFTIPFNRQELADFLGVERSAMSAELGKLAKLGILETKRRSFRLFRMNESGN